jgi:hypothetical protein
MRLDTLAKVDPYVGKYYSVEWVRKNILQQTDEDMEEINAQMEQENAIIAQQQQMQMQADAEAQQAQQQQDMQTQIAFGAQQQIAQAHVQKEVDKITGPDQGQGKSEKASQNHETKIMDKKIELEKIKASKGAPKKPEAKKPAPKKKKTVAEEARDLGLVYMGNGKYATKEGVVTHLNENGILLPYINKD